jgi:hypothetical protein
VECTLAVARCGDEVALSSQQISEHRRQSHIIFDHEDAREIVHLRGIDFYAEHRWSPAHAVIELGIVRI